MTLGLRPSAARAGPHRARSVSESSGRRMPWWSCRVSWGRRGREIWIIAPGGASVNDLFRVFPGPRSRYPGRWHPAGIRRRVARRSTDKEGPPCPILTPPRRRLNSAACSAPSPSTPGRSPTSVLTAEHLARVIAEEAGTTRDRVFTPAVTLAVFLGQVLSDDHSCQAALDRLIAWRLARGPAAVLPRHRRLLQGAAAAPRGTAAPAGPRRRRPDRGRRPRGLAVPRPPRRPRRRLVGEHARHPGQPAGVPPAPPAEGRAAGSRSPASSS